MVPVFLLSMARLLHDRTGGRARAAQSRAARLFAGIMHRDIQLL